MESFVGSLGLIRSSASPPAQWLLMKGEELRFIQADRLDGDSYRECIVREISWALDQEVQEGCLVSSYSRLHLSRAIYVPSEDQEVWFEVEFFVTDLYTEAARQAAADNPHVVWLTGAEVRVGLSRNGVPICERHSLLMAAADVIPAW